ncbi:hypothetical protein [Ascidiimonas sp. W6]|uniref:hypothetical protein n=1 Tax=Ascidiimonas meishanensis TaxID=3128903 RepID=UPI0030EE1648
MDQPNNNERVQNRRLSVEQRQGINGLGLTARQVNEQNFGQHTLEGITELRAQNQNLSVSAAFNMIRGLNEDQVEGVVRNGLLRGQVLEENFGRHTTDAMHILVSSHRAQDNAEAFQMVEGMNDAQTRGVYQYDLNREQVTTPNFGLHTLRGIGNLMADEDNIQNAVEAFEVVRGLNAVQVNAITNYMLTRAQVQEPSFNQTFVNAMDTLDRIQPNQTGYNLYSEVASLDEYQIRGLGALNLSLEQVGLRYGEDGLDHTTEEPYNRVTGGTIEVIENLMNSLDVSNNEAFVMAIDLTQNQIMGITDYGLSLDQVQSPFFQSEQNILPIIAIQLAGDDDDLELPLIQDKYDMSRAIFNSLQKQASKTEILEEQKTLEADIAATDSKLIEAVIATSGIAAAPTVSTENSLNQESNLTAFTTAALPVSSELKRASSDASLTNDKKRANKNNSNKKRPSTYKRGSGM